MSGFAGRQVKKTKPTPLTPPLSTARAQSDGLRLVPLREAAQRLSLSYWGARDLVLRGHLPATRLPGKGGKDLRRVLISSADLERFIARCSTSSSSDGDRT